MGVRRQSAKKVISAIVKQINSNFREETVVSAFDIVLIFFFILTTFLPFSLTWDHMAVKKSKRHVKRSYASGLKTLSYLGYVSLQISCKIFEILI